MISLVNSVGPHRYTFRLGSSLWAEGGTLVSATQVIRHPLYNSATIDYDVAVVKIAPAQDITEVINYATLPPDGWYPAPGIFQSVIPSSGKILLNFRGNCNCDWLGNPIFRRFFNG